MKRAIAIVLACLLLPASAFANVEDPRDALRAARAEGNYAFCTDPPKPLMGRQVDMCKLAREVDGCEGYAKACDERLGNQEKPRERVGWLDGLGKILAPLMQILAFVLVGIIVLLIAIPVIRAISRARGDRQLADRTKPNAATLLADKPPEPEEISDAEAALRMAADHERRGEFDRAIALYLAASLSALDKRGAIRIAKHRTNGEYVRANSEQTSKQALREIVREVDRAVYGKLSPTPEAVSRVASRATALVRTVAMTALVLLACGCSDLAKSLRSDPKHDPAGNALPMDVLRRSGWTVSNLDKSLATLPMPGEAKSPTVVVVADLGLEDESEAHLMRWVEAGGLVVLMGHTKTWPNELDAKDDDYATSRDLVVTGMAGQWPVDPVRGARLADGAGLEWSASDPIGKLGKHVYAAYKRIGKGGVLGIANSDLFTNIGISRPDNAAALVSMFRASIAATHYQEEEDEMRAVTIAVAHQEDAIAPPSNPFTALVRAGLGKASAHLLAACALLFLAVGIRHARARPTPPPARRAFAEHVEATGAFYGRARALPHALTAYGKFVEMRLRERVPRGADPAAFLAQRAGVPAEEASRLYKRATEAKTDDAVRGDELATIRDLRAIIAKALET